MICGEPQMPAALLIGSNSESFGSKLHATTFQSQLLSVGFVISGFPPRHAGRGPNLRVPPRPWHAEILPVSASFRFCFALCSQIKVQNAPQLAHAERLCCRALTRVSRRCGFPHGVVASRVQRMSGVSPLAGQEFQAASAQRQYRDLYRLCEEIQQSGRCGLGDPALG